MRRRFLRSKPKSYVGKVLTLDEKDNCFTVLKAARPVFRSGQKKPIKAKVCGVCIAVRLFLCSSVCRAESFVQTAIAASISRNTVSLP